MRVLIAEDQAVSRRLLTHALEKWGYEVTAVRDGREAWDQLQRDDSPNLAILDWMMPGLNGVEVVRRIRERNAEPYKYVILLTGRSEKGDLVEAMGSGADDYIVKPFNRDELEVRVRAGRRIVELQQELIRMREAVRHQARHDALTGLYNRGAILEILHRELGRARRERSALSIILADLDEFKRINDTRGHLAGDAVLREAARRMGSCVRGYDSVGRYGGEEFLCVLPGCEAAVAEGVAERIRTAVVAEPVTAGEGTLPISVSLGVASTSGPATPTADALLQAADEALYRAKAAGRNCTRLAPPVEGTLVLPLGLQQPETASGS